ncbi:uracil-DNA glycosylase, putative [Plasmodium berghei]|uniref:Uracil-DNA glycosylase n=2 Tax=Plasmodium berghei TaxID=5821 RepID=A0A509AL08_PLABA|nr:uracil-DNA glycosylase, putative [Plasmodium berghei ANKA]CXI54561.1 uracil-DNA glycosylase, putative [Plasmodium berghei]SCL94998.1 uracil-DNA glycosylase, putative [Plasmodium berghei]SCM16152.1 uracil-DNA glycosylase, putative [Plasmodium berghei]SCM17948.1 uracil-DNA glycosylase, putative [Plasmodium berghei]SCN26318.1 uracil-DNA glycosylase, putative [Plasmodium berghei]|eukprot:XP_034422076.1 uracil-DNA glycosylase, putative [Plasmodium berghei ANKA]
MNKLKIQKTIDQFFAIKPKKSVSANIEVMTSASSDSLVSNYIEETEKKTNNLKKRKISNDNDIIKKESRLNKDEDIVDINNVGIKPEMINTEIVQKEISDYNYIDEIKKLMDVEWYEQLESELKKNYFKNMYLRIKDERKKKVIYPPEHLLFTAFLKTPLSKIKVVIVGQDPYHQKGQAMGLCFSVPIGIKIPPSLKNILKEIKQKSGHGDLTSWTEQGVFLLNTSLTVEENKPASHKNYGWEIFTDKVIDIINEKKKKIVFMLWGNFAIKKCAKIDTKKHFILKSGHPSPLSIKHFVNCDHFNKCNNFLIQNNMSPIKWELPQ